MALRIILIVVIIIFVAVVMLPFFLNVFGIRIFQFTSTNNQGLGGGAGIIRSSDGGLTWQNVAISEDKKIFFPSQIYSLTFHPTDSGIIFMETKSSGLWKSTNEGISWKMVLDGKRILDPRADVYRIAINPVHPNIIYLAVFQNNHGRVLKSQDGGLSFEEIYFISEDKFGVFDIFIDPFVEDRVLIATGQGGIFETRNGGRTWRVVRWFGGPVVRLLVNPATDSEILAILSSGQVFKTIDGGNNWFEISTQSETQSNSIFPGPGVPNLFAIFGKSGSFETLVVDPQNFSRMFIGGDQGLLRSENGGVTWKRLNVLIPPEALPVDAVAIHPQDSRIIFAAASAYLHKSADGGLSWSVENLPTSGRIKTLLIHPLKPELVFAVFAN